MRHKYKQWKWPVACSAPGYHISRCRLVVNWTNRHTLKSNWSKLEPYSCMKLYSDVSFSVSDGLGSYFTNHILQSILTFNPFGIFHVWHCGKNRYSGNGSWLFRQESISFWYLANQVTLQTINYNNPNINSILQWRHNKGNGVSNHRCLDCLLNRLFRRRSKKTSKLRVASLAFVRGIHGWPVDSLTKGQ